MSQPRKRGRASQSLRVDVGDGQRWRPPPAQQLRLSLRACCQLDRATAAVIAAALLLLIVVFRDEAVKDAVQSRIPISLPTLHGPSTPSLGGMHSSFPQDAMNVGDAFDLDLVVSADDMVESPPLLELKPKRIAPPLLPFRADGGISSGLAKHEQLAPRAPRPTWPMAKRAAAAVKLRNAYKPVPFGEQASFPESASFRKLDAFQSEVDALLALEDGMQRKQWAMSDEARQLQARLRELKPAGVLLHPPTSQAWQQFTSEDTGEQIDAGHNNRAQQLASRLAASHDWLLLWCQPLPPTGKDSVEFTLRRASDAPASSSSNKKKASGKSGSKSEDSIEEEQAAASVLLVSDCRHVLPLLRLSPMLLLATEASHALWADWALMSPVWYDIALPPPAASARAGLPWDAYTQSLHSQLLATATILTVASRGLAAKWVDSKSTAHLIPSGVHVNSHLASSVMAAAEKQRRAGKRTVGVIVPSLDSPSVDMDMLRATGRILAGKDFPAQLTVLTSKPASTNVTKMLAALSTTITVVQPGSAEMDEAIHSLSAAAVFCKPTADLDVRAEVLRLKAAGLPVIASAHDDLTAVDDKSTWLVSTDKDLRSALLSATSTSHRRRAAKAAPSLNREFSWSKSVSQLSAQVDAIPSTWQVTAGLNSITNRVSSYTVNFLDVTSASFFAGGAERYLIDLAELFGENGMPMLLYQWGSHQWMRKVEGTFVVSTLRAVKGMAISPTPSLSWESYVNGKKFMPRVFYEISSGWSAVNVYSAYFEVETPVAQPSVGISHGVAWDGPGARKMTPAFAQDRADKFMQPVNEVVALVSVDTNTVNWFQTMSYEASRKAHVISNYVDGTRFRPRADYQQPREPITVIYPRRLYDARGLDLALEVIDKLLQEYINLEFIFIGRGFPADVARVVRSVNRWNNRVRWEKRMPDEMPDVYLNADITLIPTKYSEGTSLSCLEAMAAGNAIISTRVGGLSDLVIDGFNGALIDPTAPALLSALREVLEAPEKLRRYKLNSLQLSRSFSKAKWKAKWWDVLQAAIDRSMLSEPAKQPDLVTWELHIDKHFVENGDLPRLASFILPRLRSNAVIFVRVHRASTAWVRKHLPSFERIQYVSPDEDLYDDRDYQAALSSQLPEVLAQADVIIDV